MSGDKFSQVRFTPITHIRGQLIQVRLTLITHVNMAGDKFCQFRLTPITLVRGKTQSGQVHTNDTCQGTNTSKHSLI